MNKEIWKDVIGYEGLYKVSNLGRVKSPKGLKKIRVKSKGYHIVDLWNKKPKTKYIHRLVGISFIKNPKKLPTINHKDGVKSNNSSKNLEWASYSDNNNHAIKIGLRKTFDKVEVKRLYESGFTKKEIVKKMNLSIPTIHNFLKNLEDKG